MGKILVVGMDVRTASKVTFIPGAEVKRNHAILTIINNRGINTANQQALQDEVTLNFWGKYAGVASFFLYPGKQINFEGRLQSYTTDTGTVKNGKKVLIRKNEIVVDMMQLLGDSLKELNRRLGINSIVLKAAGRMQAQETFSVEELLRNPENIPLSDFNAAIAAQTGLYGKARVWSKDRGFWDEHLVGGGAGYVAPAATDIAAMAKELEAMKLKMAAMTAGAAVAEVPAPEMSMEVDMGAGAPEDITLFADAQ